MSEENQSRLEGAIEQLRNHQTQLDADGIMVGVSREALDMALAALSAPKAEAVEPVDYQRRKEAFHNVVAAAVRATFTDEADHQKTTSPSVDQWSPESFFEGFAVPAITDEAVERAYEAAKNAMPHEALIEIAPGELDRVVRTALLAAFPSKGEGE